MKRKKIWEIESNYLCSVIGTCLSLDEVRKLAAGNGGIDTGEFSDYELHGIAIAGAGTFSSFSRKISSLLDSKYCIDIFNAGKCPGSVELRDFWDKSFESGSISGAYWALLSHPQCTPELMNQAFGDVHMLSHVAGSSERTSRKELNKLQNQIESKTVQVSQLKKQLNIERKTSVQYIKELSDYKIRTALLEKQTESARESAAGSDPGLKTRVENLDRFNRKLKQRLADAEDQIKSLEDYNALLEELLRSSMNYNSEHCASACPMKRNIDLNGKRVLLVGGRLSMLPHCRSIVESMNGIFLHHDGGKEDSRTVLQNLAPGADIIICALDCVSHDASHCVKRLCQNKAQKIIMLKNSGISTFTRELRNAV